MAGSKGPTHHCGASLTDVLKGALSLLPLIAAFSVSAAAEPPLQNPLEVDPEESIGPHQIKERTRLVVSTNLPSSALTNAPAPGKSFDWKSSWQGWDGLRLELSQKTPVADPFAELRAKLQETKAPRVFHLEQVKMSGKIGAKIAFDAAALLASDDLEGFDSGAELRRARIYTKGDCLLLLPVSYQLELGYIPSEFYIEESYLSFKRIPWLGELKLGQYQAPMGLDVITSSRDITFMEPAAPIQALAPGVNAGFQMGQPVFNRRATWALGFFTDGVGQDFGDASKDYGRSIIRFTGLPLWKPASEEFGDARLLHLGFSANILYSASSTVRYQARPESHLAPHVVDTGEINSSGAVVFGLETAWVNGPFSVQAEYLHSFVKLEDGTNYNRAAFDGLYLSASLFLTGETRPYDRSDAKFGRVVPKHNFNWGRGGWGAWEIAGRCSYVNLNSGEIDGGRMQIAMAGLNWYPHSHLKWRLDFGFGKVKDRNPSGSFSMLQTRFELDF